MFNSLSDYSEVGGKRIDGILRSISCLIFRKSIAFYKSYILFYRESSLYPCTESAFFIGLSLSKIDSGLSSNKSSSSELDSSSLDYSS